MRHINDVRTYEDYDGNTKNITICDHSGKFLDDKVKPSNRTTIKIEDIKDEYETEIKLLVSESINNQELKDDLDILLMSHGSARFNLYKDITYDQLKINSWLEPIEKSLYIKALNNLLKKYKLLK